MSKEDQAPEKKMAQELEGKQYALLQLAGIWLFYFSPESHSAVELRGLEHPVREIDGVWRR